MEIVFSDINRFIALFVFMLTRVGMMFMVMPLIGTKLIPVRVRLIFVLTIVFLMIPLVDYELNFDVVSIDTLLTLFSEALIGITIGTVLQIIFHVFLLLGEMVAMQSGLGFAVLNDPSSESSVPMISQMYLMIIMLLLLSMNGHLMIINMVLDSFKLIPISLFGFAAIQFDTVANLGAWMFYNAFKIALPAVTALLMVNISFGILTKAAPQLNIFTIGFPLTMMLGIVVLWLNIDIILPHFKHILQDGVYLINHTVFGVTDGR